MTERPAGLALRETYLAAKQRASQRREGGDWLTRRRTEALPSTQGAGLATSMAAWPRVAYRQPMTTGGSDHDPAADDAHPTPHRKPLRRSPARRCPWRS